MRISINLASRPFADLGPALQRLRIAIGVLAAIALGLWFGLHTLHSRAEAARAREHSLDGAIAKIQQERQGYESTMRQPDNAQIVAESQVLNALIDEKSFSWTLAMEDLETVLPGGVQVTTLEPVRDNKTGEITLHLRVVGPRDLSIKLVANLEHSRRFAQPRIVNEVSEATGGPNQPLEPVSASNRVNFDVLAAYVPATQEERKAAHKKAEDKENKDVPAQPTRPHRIGAGGRATAPLPQPMHPAHRPMAAAPHAAPGGRP